MIDPTKSKWLDVVGGFVAVAVTTMMGFITMAPYLGYAPIPSVDAAIVSQHQTTIQNVFIAIVSFFFGTSVGTRQKDSTIDSQAKTISAAQNALAPLVPPAAILQPGQTAVVAAASDPESPPAGE